MDDLDRLYHQLIETLRERGSLEAPVALREIHEGLIPYRRVRDAAGFRTNGDYEVALSRLLAGERGYLLTDSNEMRSAVREGLDAPIPDSRRYRAYPRATVRVNPAEIPPPGDRRFAPPGARGAPPGEVPEPEEEELPSGPEEAADAGHLEVDEAPGPDDVPPLTVDSGAADDASDSHLTPGPQLLEEERDRSRGAGEAVPPGAFVEPPTRGRESGRTARCADCGARLPPRQVNYCPYCGVLLNRDACRACGTDLEPGWRFCPGCGRRRDTGPEPPAPSA